MISKRHILLFAALFSFLLTHSAFSQEPHPDSIMYGGFWKRQGTQNVMPAWSNNAVDSVDGRFYAFLDRKWNHYQGTEKYPGMMARHLFSFSTAYMLSGKQSFLNKANELFKDLKNHGWDTKYDGWFYSIDRKGNYEDPKKDLFMNIYAIAGLTMYYSVTHNRKALDLIKRSRAVIKKFGRDPEDGSFYRRLDQSWHLTDSTKVFTPQMAQVSGYLLYLFDATKDSTYLNESKKLVSLTLDHLQDPATGWIREGYGPAWRAKTSSAKQQQINIGHNIETAWMLMHLYAITGNHEYRTKALDLAHQLFQKAFLSSGAWKHKMQIDDSSQFLKTTPWWVQAYGDMFCLYTYHLTHNDKFLSYYKKSASFWNNAFVDSVYGGTMLSATLTGKIDRGDKAVRTKTSYHALEHALLNYLYLNLWVSHQPVTLYFNSNSQSDSRPLCPLPISDQHAIIQSITVGGHVYKIKPKRADRCIDLPAGAQGKIKVTIQ